MNRIHRRLSKRSGRTEHSRPKKPAPITRLMLQGAATNRERESCRGESSANITFVTRYLHGGRFALTPRRTKRCFAYTSQSTTATGAP